MRLAPPWVSELYWRRYLRRSGCSTHDLTEFPALDPESQRRDMARRLQAQLQYFGAREDALPEWREASRISDPGEVWRIWPSLPMMTKTILREKFPAAEIGLRFQVQGKVDSTGGSTGEPVHFFHDDAMLRSGIALGHWTARRMGLKPGMATLIVWGSERDIGRNVSFRTNLYYALTRQVILDGYQLTEATAQAALSAMRTYGPVGFYGFTSMLAEVARMVLAAGTPPPPGSVAVAWNGGEILTSSQNTLFQQAFGVPILNRYGGREMGSIACQYGADQPLTISRPWYHIELVDDAGRPVAAGESGRVVVTSTICRGTPFLRYQIEDVATAEPSTVTESGIGGLRQIDGRLAGLLDLPNGKRINNIFWNHLFKEFPEIVQFQVVLRADDRLLLRFRGAGFSPEREREIRQVLGSLLTQVHYEIEWVDRIPLTSRGKLLQVVNEKRKG